MYIPKKDVYGGILHENIKFIRNKNNFNKKLGWGQFGWLNISHIAESITMQVQYRFEIYYGYLKR
jgi:hypothetical protein